MQKVEACHGIALLNRHDAMNEILSLLLTFFYLNIDYSRLPMQPNACPRHGVRRSRTYVLCPIQAAMADPVLAPRCGASFKRGAAEAHAVKYGSCPTCGGPLGAATLVPNHSLRVILGKFRGSI